jgi:hypothetical protein
MAERLIHTDKPCDQRSSPTNLMVKRPDLADKPPSLEVCALLPLDRLTDLTDKPSSHEGKPFNQADQRLVRPDKSFVGADQPIIRVDKPPYLKVSAFIRTDKACYLTISLP